MAQIPRTMGIGEKKSNLGESLRFWVLSHLKQVPLFHNWLKDFSYATFLQKFLSKVRVMTLKLENKIGFYLEKLRIQAKEKQEAASNDNYWSDLKNLIKSTDGLKKPRPSAVRRTNAVVEKVAEIKNEPVKVQKKRRRRSS